MVPLSSFLHGKRLMITFLVTTAVPKLTSALTATAPGVLTTRTRRFIASSTSTSTSTSAAVKKIGNRLAGQKHLHKYTSSSKLFFQSQTNVQTNGPTSTSLPRKCPSVRYLSSIPEIDAMTTESTTYTSECEQVQNNNHPLEMTEDERYLFDLNGYLIIRGVLSAEEVQLANEIIDKHQQQMIERKEAALRNAVKGTKFYGSGPGRKDLGGVLEWGEDSKIFKKILAHPRLVPLFHGILGKGYRMDHLPFVIAQDKGAEGFQLHGGTVDCTSGQYNPHLAYTCHNGFIRSALLGCNVMLTDHDPGFGGFCVVPGSHKSNFKMPDGMVDGEKYKEFIIQPATKAGDVVLFSEGTVHGAMSWTQESQRRVCLYRFSPATNVYGRSYFGHEGGGWPDKMYEGLTDAQRAVLEPPYANRLDRPEITLDGEVEVSSRSQRKKNHDQELFGTKYF